MDRRSQARFFHPTGLTTGRPGKAILLAVLCFAAAHSSRAEDLIPAGPIRVEPATVNLNHPRRPHSLVVTSNTADGRAIDLTAQAAFASSNTAVARVTPLGWIEPLATGETDLTVTAAGQTSTVHVNVKLPSAVPLYSFRHDVMPALSKGGCNAGACHGYSLGKNGFKLSLRGADAAADYLSLSDEFFERRINRHNPPASLLLAKPLGDVPHKGGVRFEHGSLLDDLLLGWIGDGAPDDVADPVQIESVRIYPTSVVIGPGQQHQLQLIARYSDGSERDVTRLGIYTANTERVAAVDDEGLVTTRELGETAVVARFERIFATANFIVLEPRPDFEPTPVPTENVIDRHVVAKLNDLKIRPSGKTDDAHFLRRVFIDLIGVQPKADELLAFLAEPAPDKRARAIDQLFLRPEFVDRWSLKWGDLLQNSRTNLNDPATYAFREWIRVAVATNMPLDEFVRTILTSRGGTFDDPASAYFAISKDTDDTLQRATQVFCGVRMLCAKCHPHPFENWTQTDYYGLHSFFNQLGVKADQRLVGVPNAKTLVVNLAAGYSVNPRTGKVQPPRFLGGAEPPIAANVDRRAAYAHWLTSAENPFFARSMANRIWSYFFNRGIIDPVDDLRTTNPPINPALLDALTMRRHKGRISGLTVAICGDIAHSRVARSNILLLTMMGNFVRVV
ncbi:MAG TPA: DUF1549 domain-containing protein, partial [Pirellulales bacterium]|nr:DUF1549 domain-containing protein [Pirellulales bacterium]